MLRLLRRPQVRPPRRHVGVDDEDGERQELAHGRDGTDDKGAPVDWRNAGQRAGKTGISQPHQRRGDGADCGNRGNRDRIHNPRRCRERDNAGEDGDRWVHEETERGVDPEPNVDHVVYNVVGVRLRTGGDL